VYPRICLDRRARRELLRRLEVRPVGHTARGRSLCRLHCNGFCFARTTCKIVIQWQHVHIFEVQVESCASVSLTSSVLVFGGALSELTKLLVTFLEAMRPLLQSKARVQSARAPVHSCTLQPRGHMNANRTSQEEDLPGCRRLFVFV
jgi:hypothetical protein